MTILFRLLLFFALIISGSNCFAQAKAYPQRGTTQGILRENPEWSAGIQLGNHGATGLCVQKLGLWEGSIAIATGLAYGTVTISLDYLILFNDGFQRIKVPTNETYNSYRGQIQPFIGAGTQLADGFSIRIPTGVQYTMLKDPFNFFGGVAFLYGQFLDKSSGANMELWYNIGARILL